MTAPSHAEQALAQVLAELTALRALIGKIAYQVTANHVSSGGAVVEIRRLLGTFDPEPPTAPGPDHTPDEPGPGWVYEREDPADDGEQPLPEGVEGWPVGRGDGTQ